MDYENGIGMIVLERWDKFQGAANSLVRGLSGCQSMWLGKGAEGVVESG